MVLAAAKAFSASSVAITDIRPDNLPVAKQLGAKHALDQSQATSASDTVEALKAVFADGPDIVIDCVGFESTITVSMVPHPSPKPGPVQHTCDSCNGLTVTYNGLPVTYNGLTVTLSVCVCRLPWRQWRQGAE